jgi:hypothetical protein
MKKWTTLLSLVAVTCIVSWGCNAEPGGSTPNVTTTDAAAPVVDEHAGHDHEGHDHAGHDHELTLTAAKYCGKCGQAKGSESCCAKDAVVCDKCEFAKGSPLCCKVAKNADGKDFCGKCGQVAGSEVCCAKDAVVCTKCNLAKGSPLCCKLVAAVTPEDVDPAVAPEPSADDLPETEGPALNEAGLDTPAVEEK